VKQKQEYPGLIPLAESQRELFHGRILSEEETCVKGTLVTGLTAVDIQLLDFFEGKVREIMETGWKEITVLLTIGIQERTGQSSSTRTPCQYIHSFAPVQGIFPIPAVSRNRPSRSYKR